MGGHAGQETAPEQAGRATEDAVSNLPIFGHFCHPIFARKSTKKAAEASSWVGMRKMV